MVSLVSKTADQSPIALGSSASYSLVTLKAHSSNSDITSTWRPVAETTKKPTGTKLSHHNFHMSRKYVGHLENVCSKVRQKLSRPQGDIMLVIDVNAMIWVKRICNQEHRLRKCQAVVQYLTEIDPESKYRNIWDIYN